MTATKQVCQFPIKLIGCTATNNEKLLDIYEIFASFILLHRLLTVHYRGGQDVNFDEIFTLRKISKHRYRQPSLTCLIEFVAAFDSIIISALCQIMQ